MTLTTGDFSDLMVAVHGDRPFPWQHDLVGRVLAGEGWPDVIDVPTGLGKTALIDMAVFMAAAGAGSDDPIRRAPRRVFFVVDRRIVVDEAYVRAQRLAEALEESGRADVVAEVAAGLRRLAPDAGAPLSIAAAGGGLARQWPALSVTRMRGGVTWSDSWLARPDLPGVVVGTVDQVGSRLLFRGYGVSDRRRPMDAALVGTDALILVDEAHLAEVMVDSLEAAHRRDRDTTGVPRARVVQLTATPGEGGGRLYRLDPDAHRTDPTAWRRLNAGKDLRLVKSDARHVVADLGGLAASAVRSGADTVLVVCNTVDRARQVHTHLEEAAKRSREPLEADRWLLIGRSRPGDREELVRTLMARFGARRDRGSVSRPGVLVATQTVEVGADLDAEALVTEAAPWDALVQRLGRLNRLGDMPERAEAVAVHDGGTSQLYGEPREATWAALSELVGDGSALDVSPLACRGIANELPAGVRSPRPAAPLLTGPILDAWARTGPPPHPDPPVAPYLHGLGRAPATVAVLWRSGMLLTELGDDAECNAAALGAVLAQMPPDAAELVEVPFLAARQWLAGEAPMPVPDLDEGAVETVSGRPEFEPFRALAWRQFIARTGDEQSGATGQWTWIDAYDLRPGETIVVPVERGGLDQFGWAPTSKAPVTDLAEIVRFDLGRGNGRWGRRERLRVDWGTAARLGFSAEDEREFRQLLRHAASPEADEDALGELAGWLPGAVGRVLEVGNVPGKSGWIALTAWPRVRMERLHAWMMAGVRLVAMGEDRGSMGFLAVSAGQDAVVGRDDELPECSSMGARRVTLAVHQRNVGDRAAQMCRAIGLAPQLAAAVEAAARWHDLGKAEPRFQTMLCGGDQFEALLLEEPIAKSGMDPADRGAYNAARHRSGLPAGARHEAWSAALVQAQLAADCAEGIDPELVVHLVAAHHGHARPWLPLVVDDHPATLTVEVEPGPATGRGGTVSAPTGATVDVEHPERFSRLNARYGRWGLALLETVVRSADMTVSEEDS